MRNDDTPCESDSDWQFSPPPTRNKGWPCSCSMRVFFACYFFSFAPWVFAYELSLCQNPHSCRALDFEEFFAAKENDISNAEGYDKYCSDLRQNGHGHCRPRRSGWATNEEKTQQVQTWKALGQWRYWPLEGTSAIIVKSWNKMSESCVDQHLHLDSRMERWAYEWASSGRKQVRNSIPPVSRKVFARKLASCNSNTAGV